MLLKLNLTHATVYQAELEAIYQAFNYLEENHNRLKLKYVKTLTDSQSALQALNNIDLKSTIALKTEEALKNISWRKQKCKIAWVKAHIDIEGN